MNTYECTAAQNQGQSSVGGSYLQCLLTPDKQKSNLYVTLLFPTIYILHSSAGTGVVVVRKMANSPVGSICRLVVEYNFSVLFQRWTSGGRKSTLFFSSHAALVVGKSQQRCPALVDVQSPQRVVDTQGVPDVLIPVFIFRGSWRVSLI
jgi:hypothetical protein